MVYNSNVKMYDRSNVSNTIVENIDISRVYVCRISRICCFMEERRECRLCGCLEVASFFVGREVEYNDGCEYDECEDGGDTPCLSSLNLRPLTLVFN